MKNSRSIGKSSTKNGGGSSNNNNSRSMGKTSSKSGSTSSNNNDNNNNNCSSNIGEEQIKYGKKQQSVPDFLISPVFLAAPLVQELEYPVVFPLAQLGAQLLQGQEREGVQK